MKRKKPIISIIVAESWNGVIGANNDIPWMGKLKDDMNYFLRTTVSHPYILGRLTYKSLNGPLSNRFGILLSRKGFKPEDHEKWNEEKHAGTMMSTNTLRKAIRIATAHDTTDEPEIFIIGGGETYKQALELGIVDRVYITEIDAPFEGEVFFPKLDPAIWELKSEWQWPADAERNMYPFSWKVYERAA